MAIDRLFRETPFNGYNRDDVNAYIKKADEQAKYAENDLKKQYDEVAAEVAKLNELVNSLNKLIETKNKENLELTDEIMRLKNRELEQKSCICEKTAVIDELTKKNSELTGLYENLRGSSEKQEEKLKQQENKLTDLSSKNREFEENLQSCIQNSNRLREEAEAGLGTNAKIAELKAVIAEKDAKIQALEANWGQCKKDYLVYQEVKGSVDRITQEAKRQADATVASANAKRESILREAAEAAEKLVEKAKYGTTDIKKMLDNLKNAVAEINTKIDYAKMSMDLDSYVEGLRKSPDKDSPQDELVRLLGLSHKDE